MKRIKNRKISKLIHPSLDLGESRIVSDKIFIEHHERIPPHFDMFFAPMYRKMFIKEK